MSIAQRAHRRHPLLAREGWLYILLAVATTTALLTLWWPAGLVSLAITVLIIQFFRDPSRTSTAPAQAVLAAADGQIVAVTETDDPYLNRKALKISTFMNVFNVHSNRSPVDATVVQRWYSAGRFFNASLDKSSLQNERNALHLKTAEGQDIVCVQIAGLVARRIFCYVQEGDTLTRGQRYGFIRFGSRVDLYLPLTAEPRVIAGQRVNATTAILAELPLASSASPGPTLGDRLK